MYVIYSYKDDSQCDALWVNPEDLAVTQSAKELETWLRAKAEAELPDRKELIQDCDLKIMIPVCTWQPEFNEKTVEEFWNEYSAYFAEWIKVGERIGQRLKEFEGRDTYWEIEPYEFVIGERAMDEQYNYDFRVSLLSGNCFPTREAAEAFMEHVVEAFKVIHRNAGTNNLSAEANWILSGSETIHDWNWTFYGDLIAPVWPSLYICPMNVEKWKREGQEEDEDIQAMRQVWNVFSNLDSVYAANDALQGLFRGNGFYFPGIMELTAPSGNG